MLIWMMQDMTHWVAGLTHWSDAVQLIQAHVPIDLAVLDNPIKQTDLAGDVQRAFNNFVKTGQVWAFLIGLVLGYFVKTFTSFG